MENLGYLVAAYTVIWAVVFGYILYLQRKQRKLQRQLKLLEKSLADLKSDT